MAEVRAEKDHPALAEWQVAAASTKLSADGLGQESHLSCAQGRGTGLHQSVMSLVAGRSTAGCSGDRLGQEAPVSCMLSGHGYRPAFWSVNQSGGRSTASRSGEGLGQQALVPCGYQGRGAGLHWSADDIGCREKHSRLLRRWAWPETSCIWWAFGGNSQGCFGLLMRLAADPKGYDACNSGHRQIKPGGQSDTGFGGGGRGHDDCTKEDKADSVAG